MIKSVSERQRANLYRLCIPLQAQTFEELETKISQAFGSADLVEIWLDQLPVAEKAGLEKLEKIIAAAHMLEMEVLLLLRSLAKKRFQTLLEAIKYGADFVDIDMTSNPALIKKIVRAARATGAARVSPSNRTSIILSCHNFTRTPPLVELKKIAASGKKLGADIVKIITTARKPRDNLVIFKLLAQSLAHPPAGVHAHAPALIAHCMGEYGKISRILAPFYGSYISYVALDQNSRTAPGQLTLNH